MLDEEIEDQTKAWELKPPIVDREFLENTFAQK